MSLIKWSREMVDDLLTAYRQYENLYNVSHPDYIKRNEREKSLEEICERLKGRNSFITVHDVRNKIQILRSQYTKELRILTYSKKCGNSNVYKPKLWCFDKLDFLKIHVASKPSTVALNKIVESVKPLPKPEKEKRNLLSEARAALKYAVQLKSVGVVPPEESKEEIFGKFIASQLKQITDSDIYYETRWAIQNALRDGLEKFGKSQIH